MYYADYDAEIGMHCVFHTEIGKDGFAYSSWATFDQAEQDADARNKAALWTKVNKS
jgi:hypothetical protein